MKCLNKYFFSCHFKVRFSLRPSHPPLFDLQKGKTNAQPMEIPEY